MPDALHLNPQEIDTAEKRGKYNTCIFGCGQAGILYAVALVEAGFKVTCTDADQSLLRRLTKGKTTVIDRELETKIRSYIRQGALSTDSDMKNAVAGSNIIILTNCSKTDDERNNDLTEAETNCRQIGAAISRGVLVIYAGVASLGFTEGVVKETLERTSGLKAGLDFGLAFVHSPPTQRERPTETASDKRWIVAANDKLSLEAVSLVFSVATRKDPVQTLNIKVAELAALFTSARSTVSTALANELAIICEKANVDYFETLKIMNHESRESDFLPSLDGEEMKRGTRLLLESAENLGVKPRLLSVALQTNDGMSKHAASLTQDALRDCGKTFRRSRVAVLGATGPGTSGEVFVKTLEAKGARISLYDPLGTKIDQANPMPVSKRSLTEAVENCDCMVVLSAEDQFKRLSLKNLRSMMRKQAAIVDLVRLFEPDKVESEGFIYRGLGRGIDRA